MLPVLRNESSMAASTGGRTNRLESIFDRVWGDDSGLPGRAWAGVPVAMWEDDDHYYVEAEMPGVSDQDVDITFHQGRLIIRGECKPAEGRRYLYNGRAYGQFERVIVLPEPVSLEGVQAGLNAGVLSITLPKSPEAKPRKISLAKE